MRRSRRSANRVTGDARSVGGGTFSSLPYPPASFLRKTTMSSPSA
jgi:hypothetical protein